MIMGSCSVMLLDLEASTLEEAEEPLPNPRERTMAVSELTEELGLTEAVIMVFEGIDSNEQ